jgi:hypothetical protein
VGFYRLYRKKSSPSTRYYRDRVAAAGHPRALAVARVGYLSAFPPSALIRLLRELFHGHDHVAIVERYMGGGSETKRRPAASDFLYFEMHYFIVDPELEGERCFAKVCICRFDPFLEPLRIERAHVADQHRVDELSDKFALPLRC